MARAWALGRAATAGVIAFALIAQYIASTTAAADRAWDVGGTIVNFFSLFSVQTNILVIFVLLALALWDWTPSSTDPPFLERARVCVTSYAIWMSIVYNTVLRTPPLPSGTRVPWSNEVLHTVIPLVLIVDMCLAPRRRAAPWSSLWVIPLFPLTWLTYTLIRGPQVVDPRTGAPTWYPYQFLDPSHASAGYVGIAVAAAISAIAITLIGGVVIWLARRRAPATPRDVSHGGELGGSTQ